MIKKYKLSIEDKREVQRKVIMNPKFNDYDYARDVQNWEREHRGIKYYWEV